MTERSFFWGGTATGDAALPAPYGAPYSDDMFSDIYSWLFQNARTSSGVIASVHPSFNGNLGCTTTNSAITVATGIGMADGKMYASDSTVALNYPGDGTWYVVLRKSFAAQTVRLALVNSITQTDSVTWEVPIHRYIRSGGVAVDGGDLRDWIMRVPLKTVNLPLNGTTVDMTTQHRYINLRNAQDDYIYSSFVMPNDYVSGLKIYLHCTLFEVAAGTGNIATPNYNKLYFYRSSMFGNGETYSGDTLVGPTTVAMPTGFATPHSLIIKVLDADSDTFYAVTENYTLRDCRGAHVGFTLQRAGSHANDSLAQDLYVENARMTYIGSL